MMMNKRSLFNVTALALLTVFALPQTSMAGTEKSLDKNATVKPGVAGPSGSKGEVGTGGTQSTEVRNWAAIDSNKDHSIQPEEMEKYLTDSWAAQKKAATKAK
jgi:hypothetical protein